jgi:hypothetical protein
MYELSVKSVYSASPLVNLAVVPVLGDIPGLGKPMEFVFTANRPVEHPGGWQSTPSVSSTGGGVVPFPRVASNPGSSTPSNITWRTPNIFSLIQASGQTVLNVNVLIVQANYGPVLGAQSGGWVPTGITVQPGQKVWLDTQAVGMWGNPVLGGNIDTANGSVADVNDNTNIDYTLANMMLIGYTGNPPILPYGHQTGAISGDPHFIPSGNTLLNYPINYTGPISLACNDNQAVPGNPNSGAQMVRVIVTQ